MKKVLSFISFIFCVAPYARIVNKFTHEEGKYFECFYIPIVEDPNGGMYKDWENPRMVTIQVSDEEYDNVPFFRHIELPLERVSFSRETLES